MTPADLLLADSLDVARATLGPAAGPLALPASSRHRPVGDAVALGLPGPARLSAPAVLRLPLDAADLFRQHATARDVVILARAADGTWAPLPTRLDPSGRFAVADVTDPTAYVAALVTTTPCFVTATETCASRTCALPPYVSSVEGLTDPVRASLSALTTEACARATAGDYPAAAVALDAFLSDLGLALMSGSLAKGVYDDLAWRALEARDIVARVPVVEVNGTWTGSLPLAEGPRAVALQFHKRADGTVMGYALGSADGILVTDGWVGLDTLHVTMELRDAATVRTVSLHLRVQTSAPAEGPAVTSAAGTLDDDGTSRPASLVLSPTPLVERRLTLMSDDGSARAEVALALGAGDTLVAGGFASTDCAFLACGGEVHSWAEDPSDRLWLFFRSRDGRSGHVDAALDPDKFYRSAATWQTQVPGGDPVGGALVGFRSTGTTSAHAAMALAAYGRLADDLESGHDFTQHLSGSDHPSIDAGYRHDGVDAAGLLASLAGEVALYDDIDVHLGAFRGLRSDSTDPLIHAMGRTPPGVDFHDRRSGVSSQGPIVYRDADSLPPADALRSLRFDTAGAVLVGNGYPPDGASPGVWPFRLPFYPEDIRDLLVGVSGFIPFGVLGQSGGADWFRFRFEAEGDAPEVRAMAGGDVVYIATGSMPRDTTIFTVTPSHFLNYRGVVPDVGLSPLPAHVDAGDLLGTVAPDPTDSVGTRVVELSAGTSFGASVCPYWLMGEGDRTLVVQARNAHPYPEELTEPFVCNDPGTGGQALPRAMTWAIEDGANPAPGNPVAVRFTHLAPLSGQAARFAYDILDAAGDVVQHGAVTSQVFSEVPERHWSLTLEPSFGEPMFLGVAIRVDGPVGAVMELWKKGPTPGPKDVYRPPFGPGWFPIACADDGNPCTSETGLYPVCFSNPNTAQCDDDNPCTVGDVCGDGECHGWIVPLWTPCDPDASLCTHDLCVDGVCVLDTPVDCSNAPDACHLPGLCEPTDGLCTYPVVNCPEGQVCDPEVGCVPGFDACSGNQPTAYTCDLSLCATPMFEPATVTGTFADAAEGAMVLLPTQAQVTRIRDAVMAVSESSAVVIARSDGPDGSGSLLSQTRFDVVDPYGSYGVNQGSVQAFPYCTSDCPVRKIAMAALPNDQMLFFGANEGQTVSGARFALAHSPPDAEHITTWNWHLEQRDWASGVPLLTLGRASNPVVAVDPSGLNAILGVSAYLDHEFAAYRVPLPGVVWLKRRCLADDFAIEGTPEDLPALGPISLSWDIKWLDQYQSEFDFSHTLWRDNMRVAPMPGSADSFMAAWIWRMTEVEDNYQIRFVGVTHGTLPIPDDTRQLHADNIDAACGWCPKRNPEGECLRYFPDAENVDVGFDMTTVDEAGETKLLLAFSVKEVQDIEGVPQPFRVVLLKARLDGTIEGCQTPKFDAFPERLKLVRLGDKTMLFFTSDAGTVSNFGFMAWEPDSSPAGFQSWNPAWPSGGIFVPSSLDAGAQAQYSPLVRPVSAPLALFVEQQRCCESTIFQFGFDGMDPGVETRLTSFTPVWP